MSPCTCMEDLIGRGRHASWCAIMAPPPPPAPPAPADVKAEPSNIINVIAAPSLKRFGHDTVIEMRSPRGTVTVTLAFGEHDETPVIYIDTDEEPSYGFDSGRNQVVRINLNDASLYGYSDACGCTDEANYPTTTEEV